MFAPLASGRVGPAGWYFIGILLFFVWASYRSRKKIASMPKLPSRARHFSSTMVMLGLTLVLALLVARVQGIPLYPRVFPRPLEIAAGLAVAGILAAGMAPLWKRAVAKGDRRIYFFSPGDTQERALWIGVSLMAAVGEETSYRAVLYVLLLTLTGSTWAAAVLGALIFAGGHAVQSMRSMAIIFFFSLIFQGLALWTGALYVSMLAHFAYDVMAGLTYSKLAREMGYRAEGMPGVASPAPLG
jgi:membrane protease YdiL (CAAX protease family)